MQREYHKWFSPSLNRDMELLVFGNAGARVLVFPTSMGRFFEWEDRGMMWTLRDQIEQGGIQVYAVDSVDTESWYCSWAEPAGRAVRHTQYDSYLQREVLPFMQSKNSNPFLTVTGASFGAFHAVNFAFRYPTLVNRVIAMSGYYDIRRWTNGYSDDNVYFNNPVQYIANEQDAGRLEALRRMDIILATGREDSGLASNQQLSQLLWQKDIWHALRIWDGWAHDWPWWQQMIQLYIGGHD
ncbi:MAG: esterase family protein [Chloroflexi bacterium]|nr:esterase family protein [Chloroflexota bacterium]